MKRLATPLLVLASCLVALLLLEAGLRLIGYRVPPQSGFHTKRWALRDDTLGWRYNPGVWPVDCQQQPMTILGDGTRKVTGYLPGNGPTILLLGCSFAAGYGVTDEDSLASRIQAQYPGARVINLAVPGYGTYQSYLILKKYLEDHNPPGIDLVLYGYASHHPDRNVADWRWISSLKSYSGGQIVPPHLEPQTDGTWKEIPFKEYNLFSLADRSDLVFFVQSLMLRQRYGLKDDAVQLGATCHALELLDSLSKSHRIRFIAINIFNNQNPSQAVIAQCSRERGFTYILPKLDVSSNDPAWTLCPEEIGSHPNARFHDAMAREVATILRGIQEGTSQPDATPEAAREAMPPQTSAGGQ